MKKRLFSAFLVLCMVAALVVVPVQATEEIEQTQTTAQVGYCQHCKQEIPEEQWLPWDATNTGPRTGHYYLANDIADQEKQITINLDDDLCRNKICLDLRGRSYTVTGLRAFLIYGIFSIMDSVGGGEIAVTGQTGNANGAFCQMGKKTGVVDGAGELNIYSGTIRRISTAEQLVAYGGLIYAATGSTVNLHGGKLVGGVVQPRYNSSGSPVSPLGGTIYLTGSNLNVYGGTITGGIAKDGTLTLSDGTSKKYEGTGGNIYAEKKSVITISGGVIENGYAETYGGNIHAKDSTFTMTGGEIRGGYSDGAAGNINISTSGSFTMSGGVIRDGVAVSRGGNLFVNNSNIAVEITGGEIYGDLSIGYFKSLKLAGSPKIHMGLSNGLRLQSTNDAKIDVSGLTEGAEIYLDGVDQVFTDPLDNAETILSFFKDAIRADITLTAEGALQVAQGTTGYCPHCWESGAEATWTEWDNGSSTTTSVTNKTESGHYYFTANYTKKGLFSIGTSSVKTTDIVIDMASKNLTVTGKKAFNIYATLSLMDSVGSGYITSTGHPEANGGVIMGTATTVFNMYSGKLSRTVKSGEEHKNVLIGGVIYGPANSQINIYGGTIAGGISAAVSSKKNSPMGGNICAQGSFTMTAGALTGGKAYSNSYILNNTENPILNSSNKPTTFSGLGGNLYVSGKATITGGHLVGGNAGQGGNLYISSAADVEITNATLIEGLANETAGITDPAIDLAMNGGNIHCSAKNVDITDTILVNGSAREYGGNIYITTGKVVLRDSIVSGGIAGLASADDGRGGNVYLTGSGKCDMYNSILASGVADNHGGNVYGPGGVDFKMYSGTVAGGKAKDGYGGNFYCSGLTIYGGVITGGTSGSNGGNIFVYETTVEEGKEPDYNYLHIEAVEGKPAPIISNGESGAMGGNIAVTKNSKATIIGALIENGSGDTAKKTGSFDGDNLYLRTGTEAILKDTVIRGIAADGYSGNGIYTEGALTLQGSTAVINEEMTNCIFLAGDAALTVDASFDGEAAAAFADSHFADPAEPQGGTLAEANTATGVFTGKLYLDAHGSYDYGLPAIFAEENDSKLYVASTAVVDPVNDTIAWYRNTAAAASAATASTYIKLYATENAMEISGDALVDLNGNNLAVTGNGELYAFDSSNDDYEGFGTLTAAEGVAVADTFTAPNGNRYVTVSGETGYSFHRLGMQVSGVILRPSVAGMYFRSTWNCDETLAAQITGYGMAVSTANMPGVDFASDADTLYTTMAAEGFVSGQTQTSAIIENILAEGADNAARGTTPIYATTYVRIGDLTITGEDNAPVAGGVSYTMAQLLEKIDLIYPKLSEGQKEQLKALYNMDPTAFESWETYNLVADIKGTASVRPLKILTLGHSLAVDSGHMLNMIADAEGYDQEMIVATLYYSGCPLYKHVNYIKNNSAVYNLYVSSTATPDKIPTIEEGVTMEYGLKYEDWDIIIMQGGVFEIAYDDKYQDGNIQFIQNYVNSLKTNPDAIFAWHMPWACPTDNELRDKYPYSPNSYYTSYEAFNDDRTTMYGAITGAVSRNILTDDSFIYLIPSGTAIENALSSYLVEKDLHRDYVHVSDLGRVISSYTWYCTLAGIDQLDEISLDAIPKAFLKSTSDKTQDRVLTEAEKAIILESVNNALANPLHMTQSQYTVAP